MLFKAIVSSFLLFLSVSVQAIENYTVVNIEDISSQISKTETFKSFVSEESSGYSFAEAFNHNSAQNPNQLNTNSILYSEPKNNGLDMVFSTVHNEWKTILLKGHKYENIPYFRYTYGFNTLYEIEVRYYLEDDSEQLREDIIKYYKRRLLEKDYEKDLNLLGFMTSKEVYKKDNSIVELAYNYMQNYIYIRFNNKDFMDNKSDLEQYKYKVKTY